MHRISVGSRNRAYCLSSPFSDSFSCPTKTVQAFQKMFYSGKLGMIRKGDDSLRRGKIILCFSKMNVLWRLKIHVLCKCKEKRAEVLGLRQTCLKQQHQHTWCLHTSTLRLSVIHSVNFEIPAQTSGFFKFDLFPSFFALKL